MGRFGACMSKEGSAESDSLCREMDEENDRSSNLFITLHARTKGKGGGADTFPRQ